MIPRQLSWQMLRQREEGQITAWLFLMDVWHSSHLGYFLADDFPLLIDTLDVILEFVAKLE
jgi:hypothetical protein